MSQFSSDHGNIACRIRLSFPGPDDGTHSMYIYWVLQKTETKKCKHREIPKRRDSDGRLTATTAFFVCRQATHCCAINTPHVNGEQRVLSQRRINPMAKAIAPNKTCTERYDVSSIRADMNHARRQVTLQIFYR
jgi:hypothetical protein